MIGKSLRLTVNVTYLWGKGEVKYTAVRVKKSNYNFLLSPVWNSALFSGVC